MGILVKSATRGNRAVIVLAGEDAASKGTPDGGAELVVLEKSAIVLFEVISLEHVVLALLDDGLVPIVLFANLNGSSDAVSRPFGGSPVEGPALLNHPVHRSASLLQGGIIVSSMAENYINVFKLESLQRILKSLNDVLLGKEHVIHIIVRYFEELG